MSSQARLILPWQPDAWSEDEESEVPAATPAVVADPLRAAFAGAVAGALGGLIALVLAVGAIDGTRLAVATRIAFGQAAALPGLTPQTLWLNVATAAAVGMVVGAGLGALMRRLRGRVARVIFGAVLVPSLWIVFDAFVLRRYAPHLAARAPFLPWLVGAVVYGACIGVARPASDPARRV
jgi:hypothetical protein